MTEYYKESVLKVLRQRFNMNENDKSRDEKFQELDQMRVLEHLVAWNLGDPGWTYSFLTWLHSSGFYILDRDRKDF
jgi:hypothetical protein